MFKTNIPPYTPEEISLFQQILTYTKEDNKIINFVHPQILLERMETLLNSEKSEKSENSQNSEKSPSFLQDLGHFVLHHSLDTSHPLFVNQLYGGVHPLGLAASLIVERMNTNAHTFEVAPVFVLAERVILQELRKLFFLSQAGDGIFAPGGSMANMYALVLARHLKFPEVKDKGFFCLEKPLVVYTSEDAHYSVSKAANWMGLGIANVVKIKTNKEGQMIPSELEEEIRKTRAEGKEPFIVNATAGTTVLGAFDDLEALQAICSKEGMWLHCDAAWGGSFVFSERLRRENLMGIEKCDSVAWNAHKMLGAPLQCSVFITRYEGSLSECNGLCAPYLFQQDKYYPAEFDRSGDKSFQCGRKADAFKLWFMWVTLGLKGFQELVESAEDSARYFTHKIRNQGDFLLYMDKHQCTNVYFWYIPPRLQDKEKDADWWNEVAFITTRLKEKMVLEGSMMIGYSPLPHKKVPNALRLVLPAYPKKTREQMDLILTIIRRLGNDI